ncbi:hypothetical protein [Geodermatophilus siccatus]|uniref:hypothetical protein n=1 Tax=Geodermatophilus siccatus TaxID=1137991 RepID=UPI0011135913|nr:hypothetical protein [Geodermatophilus siccatus]
MYKKRLRETGDPEVAVRRQVSEQLGINQTTLRRWIQREAAVSGDPAGAAAPASRPVWWRRPVTWVAGVIGTALTATAVTAVGSRLEEVVTKATETGPPVSVDQVMEFRSDMYGDSVAFARGASFTDADLAELNQIDQDFGGMDSVEWLESRGGVAPDIVLIQLALSGNRTGSVRITNLEVHPDCSAPLDGLWFEDPPAGADDSIRMHFDLDDSNPVAKVASMDGSPTGEPEDYFPARTISLKQGEQQVIIVSASTEEKYCSFFLDMTVLEGDETSTHRITMPAGSPFEVTASLPLDQYEEVYLGGVVCYPWVKAGNAFFNGDWEHQCS